MIRMADLLAAPYGGRLVELVVPKDERGDLVRRAGELPSIQLSARSACDLELLATGAYSPLDRFMSEADYRRCLEEMRLADGTFLPVPVTLPVADPKAAPLGKEITLRNAKNELLATLRVEEVYPWDPAREEQLLYGTTDGRHPAVAEMMSWGRYCISGPLRVLPPPKHRDFPALRRTPAATRALLEKMQRPSVISFATSAVMTTSEEELCKVVAESADASLLLMPVVGLAKAGEVDHFTLVRALQELGNNYFDPRRTAINLLPFPMRQVGLREHLWLALVQRNYGATHVILPRVKGTDAWLLGRYEEEVGVHLIPEHEPQEGEPSHDMHRPEVAAILLTSRPPRQRQGVCIWFTGLPSAGKSTIAEILAVMLQARGRRLTTLDGDVVRTHLSKGLSFSKEDRDANILRIGFVAGEIVRHHGVVICAAVSPYRDTRRQVRSMVGADNFVMVYVETPVEVCEQRDVKGFYRRARAGEIKGFTGVDDPYEPPLNPDLRLTTTDCTPEQNARKIVDYLVEKGFLPPDPGSPVD